LTLGRMSRRAQSSIVETGAWRSAATSRPVITSAGGETDFEWRPGSRVPAYCTAMGKLLLTNLHESERDVLISATRLAKRGPNTITSKKALRAELDRVRVAGFAASNQELVADRLAVAFAVRNEAREVVAAASLEAHTSMISMEVLIGALGPHLLATADRISARLGYRRDDEMTAG
jgi:IclR family transcriptional regulator, pca regulon regulatory protein